MGDRLWIDIETRSRVNLKKTGVYRYVRCPDFKILMASWSIDGENIQTALTYDEIYAIPGLWETDVIKVAHNAPFERVCFSRVWREMLNPDAQWHRYLPPEQYHDTQAVAAELGYPQSLAKLAPALGATPKDEAGTRLINLFSKPNRAGGWNDHTTHPLEWLDFIAYCEQDVGTLIEVDRLLGDFPTETERRVYLVDQKINDRGIPIDVELAKAAVTAGQQNEAEQKARITELTGIDNPGSVIQLQDFLQLPDLRAETVAEVLRTEPDPVRREVLELRQELALAAPKKFASALESHVDGRICGGFRFYGAHTGRWAGRGTQPHNLTREQFTWLNPATEKWEWDETTEKAAILDLMMGLGASALDMKKLVRPLFIGPFTVADFASIEARVIAWLAGEQWVLDAARAGRDLYVETAERMSTPTRQLTRAHGKVAVLALGFQGAVGSLRVMGAEGSDDALVSLVRAWREANPRIVRFWEKMERAFRSGGPAGDHIFVEKDGHDRIVRLPSGRAIVYRKCGNRYDAEGRPRMSYLAGHGNRVMTYGGRLAENVTQGVARDILAEALIRLEGRGYPVVLHTHDEVGVEGEHPVEDVVKVMCEPPSWAAGLPIDAEGFVCERYRKG